MKLRIAAAQHRDAAKRGDDDPCNQQQRRKPLGHAQDRRQQQHGRLRQRRGGAHRLEQRDLPQRRWFDLRGAPDAERLVRQQH
jgi:hypothetical protein